MQFDHGQTVTLSGSAARGIGPQVPALLDLPATVRLGRIRPAALPSVPRFRAYFDPAAMAVAPPMSINRRDKAAEALARMYVNDELGCCVISGKAHSLGLWSGNDSDSGGLILATDQEIKAQYRAICGPGDRGCMITHVLDVFRTRGLTAGGKKYKIDGYVSVDWTDEVETKVILFLLGCSTIGFDLPEAWLGSNVWDLTQTRKIGGHDVTCIDYDEHGVYVSSWGRVYLMTWRAFTSREWISEHYAMLGQSWYGSDRMAPSGVDVARLEAALDSLAHGEIPPLPEVEPPPPPAGEAWTYTVAIDRATGNPSITQVV